jgi:hypothetical protein
MNDKPKAFALNLTCTKLGWCNPSEDIRTQVRHNLSTDQATGRGSAAKRRAREIESHAVATVGCSGYTQSQWTAIIYANS